MTSPRTAAATAARIRQAENRRAAELRERGWTCTPPEGYDGPGALQLVIRDVPGETQARGIIAPAGASPTALDVIRLPVAMPRPVGRAEQQRRQLADVEREIMRKGYAPQQGWIFGVDRRGPYAAVDVRWVGAGDVVEP